MIYFSAKNGLSDEQQNMFLEMMRNVASSTHVGLAVEEVKRSRLYTENSKVRQYLDRYWLNCVQVDSTINVLMSGSK